MTEPLSESALDEIEQRPWVFAMDMAERVQRVLLSPAERDALCQTVRAAWAERDKWQQANAEAAREINCAGPVAHRIRVLKKEHEQDIATAATRMRDACVETVRAIHEERLRDLRTMAEAGDIEDEDTEYERAVLFVLSNVIDSLKSLTLDQVEQK